MTLAHKFPHLCARLRNPLVMRRIMRTRSSSLRNNFIPVLCFFAVFTICPLVSAQDNYEIQVYGVDTRPRRQHHGRTALQFHR
jgi:hypothetical protein